MGDSGASPWPVRVTTSCVSPHPSPALVFLPLVLQSPASASPCSLCGKRSHTAQQSEHHPSRESPAVFCGGQTRDARSRGWAPDPCVAVQVSLSWDLHFLTTPPGAALGLPGRGLTPHPHCTPALPAGPPPGAPTTLGPSLGSRESSRGVRYKSTGGPRGWGLTLRTKPSGQARSYLYTL